jgi:hypothetical protein
MTHFYGLLIGLGVFLVGARIHRAVEDHQAAGPHSPTMGVTAWEWVKWLVRGEPVHDPDLDPDDFDDPDEDDEDGDDVEVHEWGAIDRATAGHRQAVMLPAPVGRRPARTWTPLEEWVAASLDRDARPVDIIRGAAQKFRASESTTKRAIRRVRSQE